MTKWVVQNLRVEYVSGAALFAQFELAAIGQLSGQPYVEYKVRVDSDGAWRVLKEKGGWWRECNGVMEELEPLLFGTIPKAQALLILKGN